MTLRLIVEVSGEPAQQRGALDEIISVLTPFEDTGTITPKGMAVLSWAREMTGQLGPALTEESRP